MLIFVKKLSNFVSPALKLDHPYHHTYYFSDMYAVFYRSGPIDVMVNAASQSKGQLILKCPFGIFKSSKVRLLK